MRLIGYWLRDLKDEEFCLPQEVVGDLPVEVRAQLASYLDAGTPHASYRGYSWCRFFCGAQGEKIGSRELTDGEWVWPEGLSHYVRTHGVILPDEFLKHVLSRTIPSHAPSETSLDLNFWRHWCAARRSSRVLERLSELRAVADKLTEKWLDHCAAEKVAQQGLSDQNCLWTGCVERALKEAPLCAKHSFVHHGGRIPHELYSIKPEHVA